MQHNDLTSYLRNLFLMKINFNFSLTEIENMMPWERDVYVEMINQKQREDRENSG